MNAIAHSIDPSAKIGEGTKVWHFTVILANVVIGDNCNIGSCCEIGRGSRIGSRTRIGFGTFLPPNSLVGDNVFIAPGVTCCDDRYPRANNAHYHAEPPIIEDNVSIGAGVVLLPGVRIGQGSMIGAGSVVARDVPPGTILRGEPAKIRKELPEQ